jgi:predicted ATPase/DNA-binding CsgD family transcriptional regulator
LLDNCEHLLSACGGLVTDLLRACPELRILATSREPLRVQGEAVYQVPPLTLPDPREAAPERLAASEAVSLFCDRARASLPGFQLTAHNQAAVVQLCRYLDGIPLAIELAAVRLRALSVHQIVELLEDQLDLPSRTDHSRPARQQTLRATMDWSHELLEEPQRVLWRRLAVFAGGFELEAAERVCAGGSLDRDQVLDALVHLVERSIVTRDDVGGRARYRLLETVQQYARERLRGAGEEAEYLRRHRDWCGELAAWAREGWWGPRQRVVLDRLQTEHDNLRAALAYCQQAPDEAAAGLAICSDTWFFWNAQHHLREGARWLSTLLAASSDATPVRALALTALGTLHVMQGDGVAAAPVLDEAVALCRRLGEAGTLVLALGRLGSAAAVRGDVAAGAGLTGDALLLGRELGDPQSLATVLSLHARMTLGRGDPGGAVDLYRECVELCRQADEQWLRLRASLPLAVTLSEMGGHAEAEQLMREGLAAARHLDDERMMAWTVEGLAWMRAAQGQAEDAARLLGAATAIRTTEAGPANAADRARTERCRDQAVERLGERGFERAFSQGARLAPAAAVALALGEPAERKAPRSAAGPPALSERESEIAKLVAEGLSNREIADRLFISVRTAENHVNHILVKLGLRSRAQLARWFVDGKLSSSADVSEGRPGLR